MIRSLDDYRGVVGDEVLGEIYSKARGLLGRRVIHVNATQWGGGVAEILSSLVPLMNDVGIEADWRTLHGTPDFFMVTKKFHNALQGDSIDLNDINKKLFIDTNEAFAAYCQMHADCIIVHDPQPLPLIKFYKKKEPWVWRCHVDLSAPTDSLWEFLKTFIMRYDVAILSSEAYKKDDLAVEQRIIHPAIDPLSLKNMEMPARDISRYLRRAGIPADKPLVTQVSRMDIWKDPEGLLEVFKIVKEKVDCRLVYCYDMAGDDPEGRIVYEKAYRKARKLVESGDVIFVMGSSHVLVNAIQRASAVVVQNSLKEGFCLCVTEALWKGKPVVATNVGGIPQQITDGESGFLVNPRDREAFAGRIVQCLRDPEMARGLGEKGREGVKENFLITRLLLDYLNLIGDITWGRRRVAR